MRFTCAAASKDIKYIFGGICKQKSWDLKVFHTYHFYFPLQLLGRLVSIGELDLKGASSKLCQIGNTPSLNDR